MKHCDRRLRIFLFWFCSFVICITPALVNGFPFNTSDSRGYDGQETDGGLRSAALALIAHPLYLLVGPWSLVVINSVIFAFLLTRLTQTYLGNVPRWLVLLLSAISLVPLFTSTIMADIWAIFLAIAFLRLWQAFSWCEFVIAVLACASHGSNAFIFAGSLLATWMVDTFYGLSCFRGRQFLIIGLTVLISGIVLNFALNPRSDRLSTALIASKIMNDVPEAFDAFCKEQSNDPDCLLLPHIHSIPRTDDADDALYLWELTQKGLISIDEMNKLGLKLGLFVSKYYPLQYVWESAMDFARLMTVTPHPLGGVVQHVVEDYGNRRTTLVELEIFTNQIADTLVFAVNIVLILIAGFLIGWLARNSRGSLLVAALFCFFFFIANDLFFAFTNGGYLRSHLRVLFLPALVVLFANSLLGSKANRGEGKLVGVHPLKVAWLWRARQRSTP